MELYDFYSNVLNIKNDTIVMELSSLSKIKFVNKGFMIAEAGKTQTNLYFLIEGVFRGFFYDEKGSEITDCLGFECGQPLVSAFAFREKSYIYISAVTDAKVVEIKLSDMKDRIGKYKELLTLYNELLYKSLESHWKLKEIRYRMSAIERYNWFLEAYPNLNNYIRDKDIASFLGMSPVTLCRIKK